MAAITLVDIAPSSAQSSRSLQFNILSLPDPGNDDDTSSSMSMREYMLVSSTHPPRRSSTTPAAKEANKSQQQQPYDIYEIQTILPHSGKYASYFVGSRIISNPALHITTRVDPLFFALAHLHHAMTTNNESKSAKGQLLEKWQPWDQALGGIPSPILRALNLDPKLNINGVNQVGQLGHLLDVSDMCGDDLILCKFSEERALKWLVAKFEKSVWALRRRLQEKKRRGVEMSIELKSMQGGSGAFSSSFTVVEEEPKAVSGRIDEKELNGGGEEGTDSALSKEEEQSIRVGALQLICDYIPTEWKGKLSKEVGMTDADWMGKKKSKSCATTDGEETTTTKGEKRSRSSWEGNIGQEDADALLQYTVGGSGKVITPGEKKEVLNAQSVGLKRLAKVNTKGMKSMSSFFGASKKKK
mmetsp:Transcript_32684/g.53335  ORF Transcript_32684/g.53335 Transcript_32684/m.53335 type:complete len:414 (+) Transcript_32684:90-1331(+)